MPREQRFSERIGIVPSPLVQLESVSVELKNAIWNLYENLVGEDPAYQRASARYVVQHFYKSSLWDFDERRPRGSIYGPYALLPWYSFYDFLEFLVQHAMMLV